MEFNDIIGEERLIEYLRGAIRNAEISHAYIINGPAGCGKRTIAAAFARAMGCRGTDLVMVSHEKERSVGVEDIRSGVNSTISMTPIYSDRKVYIIPDASLMTPQAQNALLKTFEEPPEFAVIILLSENKEALLDTIRSRAIVLDVLPVRTGDIADYLVRKRGLDEQSAQKAAIMSSGSIGQAISMAEDTENTQLMDRVIGLMKETGEKSWDGILESVKEIGKENAAKAAGIALMWLRDVLVVKAAAGLAAGEETGIIFVGEEEALERAAEKLSYEELSRSIEEVMRAQRRIAGAVSPQLSLEYMFAAL